MNDLDRLERRATRALAAYDLATAGQVLQTMWSQVPHRTSLRAAVILLGQAKVHAWSGESGLARAAFDEAFAILRARHSAPDLDELARALANRAQLEIQCGYHGRAEYTLLEAQRVGGHSQTERRIRLLLAKSGLSSPSRAPAARRALAQIFDELNEGDADDEGLAHALEVRGQVERIDGRFADARRTLEEASALYIRLEDELAAQENARMRAAVHLALGDFDTASRLLDAAIVFFDERGFVVLSSLARLDRAVVRLCRGDNVAARELYTSARDGLERLDEIDPRIIARTFDGMGTVARQNGRLVEAADWHRKALALLEYGEAREQADGHEFADWSLRERASTLANLAADHLAAGRLRYLRTAIEHFEAARAVLDNLPDDRLESARCSTNLGVARALIGDSEAARRNFDDAAQVYQAAGAWLELATVDHNSGCLLSSGARDADVVELRAAVALLTTAALARDAARFDFEHPLHRRRWWSEQAAASVAAAIDVAVRLEEHSLVAELIAAFRLSGLQSLDGLLVDRPSAAGGSETASDALPPSTFQTLPPPELRVTAVDAADFDGEALVAVAPGPRLRMAGGRIALEHYIDMAESRYGPQRGVRLDTVVDLIRQV